MFIIDGLGRRCSLLKGCHIDVGFEGRTWLAIGQSNVHLSIDGSIVVVDAAQHRENSACVKIKQHLGGVGEMVRVSQLSDMILHDLLDLVLQINIERGVDDQA